MEPSRGQILLNRGKQQIQHLQQVTTLHASRIAILLQGKQQNTTRVPWMEPSRGHNARRNQLEMCQRRSVVFCCFATSKPWSAWASKRRCPREALFKVVKVVQVVFPFQQAVLETQVSLSLQISDAPFSAPFSASRAPLSCDCWTIVGENKDNLTLHCRKWRENIVPLHLHSR